MAPGALPAPLLGSDRLSRWAAVAIGASIPVSVALDNILLAIVLLAWLAGGNYREKWAAARANPVALAALLLFGVLLAGTLYGDRYPGDATAFLAKYADLLAVPVLVYLFRDPRHRGHALAALAAGLVLTLVVSYLVLLGVLAQEKPLAPDPLYPLAFKFKLTHNILLAYAAFLFAHFAAHATATLPRCTWTILSLLAALNVLFLVDGLTGQVMLGAFVVYGAWRWKGWRGLAAGAVAAVLGAALLVVASDSFRGRLGLIVAEVAEWRAGRVREDASASTRLALAATAIGIVRDHPLLGAGTGSYPKAHAERSSVPGARNPHSEMLLIAAQTGVVGLAALLWLFFLQWRLAARLPELEASLARGLVLMMVIGCLVNSMLLDHTEGLLYAWLTGVLYGGLRGGLRANAK
jgi:O-antigen ligase